MTETVTFRDSALAVMQTLSTAGYKAFMAGGCVRDTLLGLEPKDFDVTTSATPAQVKELFDNADFVGAHFGVSLVKVNGFAVEVATFRRDGEYSDNRRPDSVELTQDETEDVKRRDFTVNALLMDAEGNVADHVGGLADLNLRLVRCVGNADDRFNEDALRLLRAVRFCVTKEFELEHDTFQAIKRNAHLVKNVSAERVRDELSRMLVSGHADVAFDLLLETGLAEHVMPELVAFVGCEHNSPKYHPEGDVANHVKKMLGFLPKNCSLTLALGVLCHDIAKPNTRGVTKEGKTHFRGHENVGAVMTEEILKRLKYSNDVVEVVVSHVKNHMKFFVAKEMKRSTMVRFARLKNFSELVELGKLDALGSNGNLEHLEFVEKFLNENADVISSNRLINGNDLITLGMMPSPKFKVVLDQVETAQLEGRVKTKEDALNLARKLR